MSLKNKFSVLESQNMDVAQGYDVQTALTPNSTTEGVYSVSPGAAHVHVQVDASIYYTWSNATSAAINATNDFTMQLTNDAPKDLRIPWAVGTTPVFHALRVDAGTANVKIVEG